MHQRQKRGFALPIERWMNNELQGFVGDTCSPSAVKNRGILNGEGVAALMSAGATNPGLLYPKIWALVILELWCRSVLDTADSRPHDLNNGDRPIDLMPIQPVPQNDAVVDGVGCG
jgi:hypothetical protein